MPLDYGSDAHLESTWVRCSEAWRWEKKGAQTKPSRWFQVHDAAKAQLPWFACLGMVMDYVGLYEQWDDKIADAVAEGGSVKQVSTDARLGPQPGPTEDHHPAENGSRPGVKESDQKAKGILRKAKSYKHLAWALSNNWNLHSAWCFMRPLTKPVRVEHTRTLEAQTSVEGSRAWAQSMASGKRKYCAEVMNAFLDGKTARRAGFCAHGALEESIVPALKSQKLVANGLWKYCCLLVATEYTWLARYTETPLGKFMALDTNAEEEKNATLAVLKVWWEYLLELERLSLEDEEIGWDIDSALNLAFWPRQVFVRELFLGLAEAKFELVPDDIMDDIVSFNKMYRSTKANEDASNVLRDKARHCKGGKIGRMRRQYALLESHILKDIERVTPAPRRVNQEEPPPLPSDMFGTLQDHTFTLDERLLDECMAGKPTPGSTEYLLKPTVWVALLHYKGQLYNLNTAFQTLFFRPGDIVYAVDSDVHALVLQRNDWAALLADVLLKPVDDEWEEVELRRAAENDLKCNFVCGVDPTAWNAWKVTPMIPREARRSGLDSKYWSQNNLMVNRWGPPDSVFQRSARVGFRDISCVQLQKYIRVHQIPYEGTFPALLRDVCTLLIKHAFPDFTDKEVEECLKRRGSVTTKEMPTVLDQATVEKLAVTDFVDEGGGNDVIDDVVDAVRKSAEQQFRQKPSRPSKPAAVGGEGGGSKPTAGTGAEAAGSHPKGRIVPKQHYTVAEAKKFMPQALGATIVMTTTGSWESRYRYRKTFPKSHAQKFQEGNIDSEYGALTACLRWAWNVHFETCPDAAPCEWDFSTLASGSGG